MSDPLLLRGKSPSDPCVPGVYCELGDRLSISAAIYPWDGSVPRATIMRRFANAADVRWDEVGCVVRYARPYTRQEVWDEYGRGYYRDELNAKAQIGWYFDRPAVAGNSYAPSLPAGWYSDIDGVTPAKGYEMEDTPTEPPAYWAPGEGLPSVLLLNTPECKSYPERVVRVLYCEVRS